MAPPAVKVDVLLAHIVDGLLVAVTVGKLFTVATTDAVAEVQPLALTDAT